jgi:protein TonB
VETNGRVSEVRVARSSGFALLDRAAIAAVRKWEIEPLRRNHAALVAWVELPVIFQLRGEENIARHP